MSVFVGPLSNVPISELWPWSTEAIMTGDSRAELDKMLHLITERPWIYGLGVDGWVYRLDAGMKRRALAFGAVEATSSKIIEVFCRAHAASGCNSSSGIDTTSMGEKGIRNV